MLDGPIVHNGNSVTIDPKLFQLLLEPFKWRGWGDAGLISMQERVREAAAEIHEKFGVDIEQYC